MISTKQRAFLKSLSHGKEICEHIGQNGLTDAVCEQIDNALVANELVKIRVLPACPIEVKEVMNDLCQKLLCEGILVIGRVIVIYKKSTKKGVKHLLD